MRSLAEPLQMAMDNGARRALIPIENKRNFLDVSADIVERVDPIFYSDPVTAALKALGINLNDHFSFFLQSRRIDRIGKGFTITSSLSNLNLRVETFKLNPSISASKPPKYLNNLSISFFHPGVHLSCQGCLIWNTSIQTLASQHT